MGLVCLALTCLNKSLSVGENTLHYILNTKYALITTTDIIKIKPSLNFNKENYVLNGLVILKVRFFIHIDKDKTNINVNIIPKSVVLIMTIHATNKEAVIAVLSPGCSIAITNKIAPISLLNGLTVLVNTHNGFR